VQGPGCKKHPSPHAYRDRTDGKVYAALQPAPRFLSHPSGSVQHEYVPAGGLWSRYAEVDARDAGGPFTYAKAAGGGRCTARLIAARRVVSSVCDTRGTVTATVHRAGGCIVFVRTVTGNDLRPAEKET